MSPCYGHSAWRGVYWHGLNVGVINVCSKQLFQNGHVNSLVRKDPSCVSSPTAKEVERVRCQCVYAPTLAYTCTFQCLRSCLDRSRAEGLAIRFLSECVFTSPADRRSSFIPVTSQPLFMSALGGFCEEAAAFSSESVALTQRPSDLMATERACDSF